MSTINIDLAADTILNVMIGQQDENEVREVIFDFSGWYTTYGSGTISLAIQRPKDEWPYEGTLTVDSTNHQATWEISETDTAYAGTGQIQLSYKVGDAKKKSVVYRFTCHKSLGALGSVVTPVQIQTFIDEVEEALQTMDGRLDDMDDQITDVKQDLSEYEQIFTADLDESVSNWLDLHPEATTTVEDHSLTYEKLVNGTLGYVTPEMYGAVGDGATDDTQAFQSAVDSGKPILLTSDYKCGKVTGANIAIVGNGHLIENKTNDILFSASGDFTGENFTIKNQETFDYLSSDTIYGSISAVNVHCNNVNFININSCAVYVTGNLILDNCIIDNSNFDVKTIYDGSSNNHSFGVYIRQTTTEIVSVKNCRFLYLIEGVYFGSYTDSKIPIKIDNNYFYYVADHCCYINSLEDRTHAVISNNLCYKVATAFATVGNGHVIENNLVYGAYDGDRQCFGFSIRDGSNVTYKNNIFVSGNYTTSEGLPASCLITSLLTNAKRDNIVFEGNYIDINDSNTTMATWLRMGYGEDAPLGKITFRNNVMSIKGCASGLTSNVAVELILENNHLVFNQGFMNISQSGTVTCLNNYIENLDNNGLFSTVSIGIYKHNTFNTKGIPLRRATATLFDVEGNVNKYTGGNVYNLVNTDATGLTHKCMIKTTFTATAAGAANVHGGTDVQPAFKNKMIAYDDLGNELAFTVTQIRSGYIDISGVTSGTHNCIIF